jgi:Na+-translocating ferredoxin:NAD+ oxidoreductase RnfD subunit
MAAIDFAALALLAILIGGALGGGLGAAWYSPALFGPAWVRSSASASWR